MSSFESILVLFVPFFFSIISSCLVKHLVCGNYIASDAQRVNLIVILDNGEKTSGRFLPIPRTPFA